MTFDFSDRVAVVTGAASGIGAAIARQLAAGGARVALLARRTDRLTELADRIAADSGTAFAVTVDVTRPDQVDAAARAVTEQLGRVDLLVNNAGVMLPAPIADRRGDLWERMVDTNVSGVLHVTRAFLPDLLAAGADGAPADLVNVSSIGAHLTFPGYAVYGATKAAVTALSEQLRAELGPRDVRVTNLEPGLTETELGSHVEGSARGQLDVMLREIPPLSAQDLAELVGFVVSRPSHVNVRHLVALPTRQA